jgi:hypothetical protein
MGKFSYHSAEEAPSTLGHLFEPGSRDNYDIRKPASYSLNNIEVQHTPSPLCNIPVRIGQHHPRRRGQCVKWDNLIRIQVATSNSHAVYKAT